MHITLFLVYFISFEVIRSQSLSYQKVIRIIKEGQSKSYLEFLTLGGRSLRYFLQATNQRALFTLRHILNLAGLAALVASENTAINQHSYAV